MNMKITEDYLLLKESTFLKRFNGFCLFYRARYLLVINGELTFREFYFYSLLTDVLADWDSRHSSYGTFILEPDLFAYFTSWSISTVKRLTLSLIRKGYIALISSKTYAIVGFQLGRGGVKKGERFDYYDELEKVRLEQKKFILEQNGTKNDPK